MHYQQYQHWQLDKQTDGIIWLKFDRTNASTNTINHQVLDELEAILHQVLHLISSQAETIKGLVIYSGKPNGFIAGADVHYFSQFTTTHEIEAFLQQGQNVFATLASLPIPTVAMIDGFCFGGGLELALVCRYRIATASDETRLGLPEVWLGIHPGWGGSVRLPRLIGPFQALPMMLQGKPVSAKKAERIGLIDAAVPKRQLKHAAHYFIHHCPQPHKLSWWLQLVNRRPMCNLLAKIFYQQLAKKIIPAHYPAPYAIVQNWEHGISDVPKALHNELNSVVQLLQANATTKNLIRVFLLQERLKALGKQASYLPAHVHVIGAGVMGGDIAAWCAFSGLRVTLQDVNVKNIAASIARAYLLFRKKLKDNRQVQAAMDRLIPDATGQGITKADVIIEAIFESLEAKKNLFKQIEQQAKTEALLATNTSSIPLDDINQVMTNPSRLVGIHFFNPVDKMKLVEVVQGTKTAITQVELACAFVSILNHLPLPVKSCPGFLVNRILMPYLLEAVVLAEQGYAIRAIDQAAIEFGMPMGPIQLADTVGLDVCLAVAKNLTQYYGGEVPSKLITLVEQGHLGCKTAQGFYRYKKGKPISVTKLIQSTKPITISTTSLADCLITKLTQEAKKCLEEKIVADSDLLDAGMIFGAGFAPFRGGPIHYLADK